MTTPPSTTSDPVRDYQKLMETLESVKGYRISRGRIEIKKELLGFGGYSDVTLATLRGRFRWFGKGKSVAVKQLRASGSRVQRTHMIFTFVRELTVWARLEHPRILRLLGFYLDGDMETAWLLSPYEEQGNIREYLDREKPSEDVRLQLAVDTVEGLMYLHDQGVCHGDIKAGNVLVTGIRRAMLCDFGLAKIIQDGPSGLTTSKGLKGSTRYLAPELAKIDPPIRTFETDIWAWACLLVEILVDRIPYSDSPTEPSVMVKIFQGEPPAVPLSLDIPDHLKDLLALCWSDQPALRPTVATCFYYIHPRILDIGTANVPPVFKKSGPGWVARFAPGAQNKVGIDLERTISIAPYILALRFSPDGRSLAAGGIGSVYVYDVGTEHLICSLPHAEHDRLSSLSFSPDGKLLATSGYQPGRAADIRVWNIASRTIILHFPIPRGSNWTSRVSFSPDGTFIAYSFSSQVHVYDIAAVVHRPIPALSSPGQTFIRSLAISPNSQHIVIGDDEGLIRIADATGGVLLATLMGHAGIVLSLAFAPDGGSLVSSSGDSTLKVWDLAGLGADAEDGGTIRNGLHESARTLPEHKLFWQVGFSPSGKTIVSRSRGTLGFWDAASGCTQMPLRGMEYDLLAVSPVETNSGWLLAAGDNWSNQIQIFRCQSLHNM